MKVKICGITNLEDAMQAISFGADALGFQVGMRHKTEDEVSPKEAKVIVASLPPFVSYVMVTHLQDAKTIISLLELIQKITTVQLHDNNDMDLKKISAIREKIPSVTTFSSRSRYYWVFGVFLVTVLFLLLRVLHVELTLSLTQHFQPFFMHKGTLNEHTL
jgi:phosphoribosylanthranilate isomerase